jgi:hypothetical protein
LSVRRRGVRDPDHLRARPFLYRYRFIADDPATVLELDATLELAGPAAVLGPLVTRAIKRGADANLATLKHIQEARTS